LPAVLDALITVFAATEGHESSKTLFYVVGGLLAVFAVLISALGISRIGSFPSSKGQTRGIIGLAGLLVVAAMAATIITS
jgi:hypothetical protein